MAEFLNVRARLSDGSISPCRIGLNENIDARTWTLTFSGLEWAQGDFVGDDLFKAMIKLRLTLEKHGAQLLCQGARPNVFPSGMSRGMGGGRKAYVTDLGEQATDLVDIFDTAAAETVDSVDRQAAYREEWFESLTGR